MTFIKNQSLQPREQKQHSFLFKDLGLFFTAPLSQVGDRQPMVARDVRSELQRLKTQISRVEKALEGLPDDARPDQVRAILEERKILTSETR